MSGAAATFARTRIASAPRAISFESSYPGTADQPHIVRGDLEKLAEQFPMVDELVLLASELATNAILHSRSGDPGRWFTVRAVLYPGDYAWVEVADLGGAWGGPGRDDEHGRGLSIVAGVAGEGNWGIDGDDAARVAWFRLDWPRR